VVALDSEAYHAEGRDEGGESGHAGLGQERQRTHQEDVHKAGELANQLQPPSGIGQDAELRVQVVVVGVLEDAAAHGHESHGNEVLWQGRMDVAHSVVQTQHKLGSGSCSLRHGRGSRRSRRVRGV